MTLLNVLQKKLPTELMSQVRDALGDDFDFDYVPRSRLNTVIAQRNELRTQVAAPKGGQDDDVDDDDTKAAPATKGDKGTKPAGKDKDVVDTAALEAKHAKELLDVKLRYALTDELRTAKCKNPDLLISKFDMSKLSLGEDGKLTGHTEVIEAWKKSDGYLFESAGDDVPDGTGADGVKPGGDGKKPPTEVDKLINEAFGI